MIHLKILHKKYLLAIAATALVTNLAWAQPFPNKPVKIIVTAAPGGTTDISSRALADILGKELGQTVIVENKAGAANNA